MEIFAIRSSKFLPKIIDRWSVKEKRKKNRNSRELKKKKDFWTIAKRKRKCPRDDENSILCSIARLPANFSVTSPVVVSRNIHERMAVAREHRTARQLFWKRSKCTCFAEGWTLKRWCSEFPECLLNIHLHCLERHLGQRRDELRTASWLSSHEDLLWRYVFRVQNTMKIEPSRCFYKQKS